MIKRYLLFSLFISFGFVSFGLSQNYSFTNNPVVVSIAPSSPIPSPNLIFWISADCITLTGSTCSYPSNGTTNPATWSDRSPTQNNAIWSVSSGGTCTFNTNQINGLPAMTWTSAQACVYAPGSLLNTSYTNGNTINAFMVYKRGDATSYFDFFTCAILSVNCLEYRSSSTNLQILCDPRVVCFAMGAAAANTNWNQVNFTLNYSGASSSSASFRLNEAADGSLQTGLAVSTLTTNTCCVPTSSDFPLQGQIAEMIIYSGSTGLTMTQITTIESYLHTKYNI